MGARPEAHPPVVAAAILDRLLDRATVVNIKGSSWRLRQHEALTKPLTDLAGPPRERPEEAGASLLPGVRTDENFGEAKNANFDERLQPITDVDLFVEGLLFLPRTLSALGCR